MSRTKCAVCLLALAGSAFCYFSFRPSRAKPLHPGKQASLAAVQRARSFSMPAIFEPNPDRVQFGVQFVGRGNGMAVLLDGDGIAFSIARAAGQRIRRRDQYRCDWYVPANQLRNGKRFRRMEHQNTAEGRRKDSTNRAGISGHVRGTGKIYGTGREPVHRKKKKKLEWLGTGDSGARASYFIGDDPRRWRRNVPLFSAAQARRGAPVLTWSSMAMQRVRIRPEAGAGNGRVDLRLAFSSMRTCESMETRPADSTTALQD